MRSGLTRLSVAVLALAVVTLVYGWRLEDVPVYPTADELIIGLNGHALATTGHDRRGRWLPLFFQIDEFRLKGTIWYQPVIMYATAGVLTIAPLSEWAIRLPAVLAGLVDVALMFLIVRQIYQRTALAAAAAALLALTPAHFVHSRFAMDYILPLPFLLAWLLAQVHYQRSRDARFLFAATLALGLGLYSYIAAVAMMPIYLAMTAWLLWRNGAPARHYAVAAAGVALPLTLFVAWLAGHQTIVAETFARYDLANPERLGWIGRISLYWGYLSPSYLFFSGGSEQVFAPRTTGVFLLSLAPLLAVGIYRAVRSTAPIDRVVLVGFLTAPLAALLLDAEGAINRSLEVLPFGVLLAAGGLDLILPKETHEQGARRRRLAIAIALVVASLVQWRGFVADYFGDYRIRSAPLFQGNIEPAIEAILAREGIGQRPDVYIFDGLDLWWTYYVRKHQRPDLVGRTIALGENDDIPRGSLALINVQAEGGATHVSRLTAMGAATITSVADIDGRPSFVVLQR